MEIEKKPASQNQVTPPKDPTSASSKLTCSRTPKRGWFDDFFEANNEKILSPFTREVFFGEGAVTRKLVQKKKIEIPLGKLPLNFVPLFFLNKNNHGVKRDAEDTGEDDRRKKPKLLSK